MTETILTEGERMFLFNVETKALEMFGSINVEHMFRTYRATLADRLITDQKYGYEMFTDILTLDHFSFSRIQKSNGAWALELKQDGRQTGFGSSTPIRQLLRQADKLGVSHTGSIY